MRIFISNLSFRIQHDDLRGFFESYGVVASAFVIIDKSTGQSKGFGFVEMPDDAAATRAIAEVNGSTADGRVMKVAEAKSKKN